MLGIAITFLTILGIVPALSSYFSDDCKTIMEKIKKQKCRVKVENIEGTKSLTLTGTTPYTFMPCQCSENSQWWSWYKDEIEQGDYFIKNEGENYFEIIKEDTVIRHEYICSPK